MGLTLTVTNSLPSGTDGNTATVDFPSPLANPTLNPDGDPKVGTLSQNQILNIHIGDGDTGGAFHIGINPTSGTPSITVQRAGNHWKITNRGTNTDSSVTVGPDGQ